MSGAYMVGSRQWRTERAEVAIRPGRHFETGGKKEKRKKKKKEKGQRGRKKKEEREKKKIWKKHVITVKLNI